MSKHSIVKTGLGVGLMAASLGAMADMHTFAEPMIYYKVNGAAVNYVAFVPSMGSANVVLLDMYQSGTISSWNYGVNNASIDAGAGGTAWSFLFSRTTDTQLSAAFQNKYFDGLGNSSGNTYGSTTIGSSTQISSSWYGGNTGAVSHAYSMVQTVSSQACSVSFVASINTEDYLLFTNFTVAGLPTASDSVSFRTKSGTSASDTASSGSAAWNAVNFSATSTFPTFSAFSIPAAAGGALQTIAASVVTRGNVCNSVYTAKNALNSAGGTIGAKAGLMRLW